MSYSILPTNRFAKELTKLVKKFPSLKMEYALLITDLINNPDSEAFIGNNYYNVRIAVDSKGKGKSGGARIITYLCVETEMVSSYYLQQRRKRKPKTQ